MTADADALTYERLRERISTTRPAPDPSRRELVWAEPTHVLGVARDPKGRLEVFVVGEPLEPTDHLVAENVQHHVWRTSTGAELRASRLVLSSAEHFDGVAAFICTELVAKGIEHDPVDAFRSAEPVIALALRRAALSNQAMVGLAGELYVLARLTQLLPHRTHQVVDGWFGSVPSSRDLQLGPVGVEIKTTTGGQSHHHISGLHQVEVGASVDAVPETHLLLLSIGVEWLPASAETGRSIPELVEVVSAGLGEDSARRDAFIARVKQYGGDAAIGYDHDSQRHSARYVQPFVTTFERLYDLADERIKLLRTEDVREATHVDVSSINYRLQLPSTVTGDRNPVIGMSAVAARLDHLMTSG